VRRTIDRSRGSTILPPDEGNAHNDHDGSVYDRGYGLGSPDARLVRG
jgi:hypothetical protein